MEKRKCLYCDTSLPETKRADSKFCNNSCKAWYWEKNKGNKREEPRKEEPKSEPKVAKGTPLEGLRGVIDNTPKEEKKEAPKTPFMSSIEKPQATVSDCPPTDKREEQKQVNPEYKKLAGEKEKVETEIKKEEEIIKDLNERIEKIKNAPNPHKVNRPSHTVANSDVNLLHEELFGDAEEKELEFEMKRENTLKQLIAGRETICKEYLEKNKQVLKNLDERLSKTKQFLEPARPNVLLKDRSILRDYFNKSKPKLVDKALFNQEPLSGQETVSQSQQKETKEPEKAEQEPKTEDAKQKVATNERVISNEDLLKIDYKSLDFRGRWKDFLGQPAVIFHAAVHGLPGGGKSTFCLQLSDYLAKNFGNVIYVSGEEGFSKTLQEKLERLGIKNKGLYFHNAKNYDDIKLHISPKDFHFIVIDSLDTLRIDAIKLKELKEYYPQSAFVTISQSRKDGKMKGDNEILHDADTVIGVDRGTATTSKNRFNASNRTFEVFPSEEKKEEKNNGLSGIKNVI